MKNSVRHIHPAVMIAGAFAASIVFAADPSETGKSATEPKNAEEILKKVAAAGTPGAAHKVLDPLIGDWTAEVTCWMAPGSGPTVSKATAKTRWAFNGRFVQEEFSGEMMGKPFKGLSLTGYDNQKQKYNSLWVDDTSTSIFTSEGIASEGGKVITFTGKMDCPVTGDKDIQVKHVLRIISPDKHVFEMHDLRRGEQSKSMEITYTRSDRGATDVKSAAR